MENKIDKKKILLIVIIPLILILLLGILFYININKTITIKATVKYINNKNNYIIVKDNDSKDEYILNTEDEYNSGDILLLTLYKINNNTSPKEATIKKLSILSRTLSFTIKDDATNNKTDNNESNSNDSTTDITNDTNNSNDNNTSYTEDDIIEYFYDINKSLDNYNNDKSISEKIKSSFVSIVDFLFYGKEIKGKTFNELSTSAKLKVLKLALSIDTKIDSAIPGYKESLSNSYHNLKSKIVEKYLDITTDVCSKNEDTCTTAKEGLTELKENFSLTWSFIKNISGISASKLKSWYEVWRES